MLERIIKGFWGRYLFFLLCFVAAYMLMRDKLDEIIYGLGDSFIAKGEHPYISLFVLCVLSVYPMYRILKYSKKTTIDIAHVAFLFIPLSVWYLIQLWIKPTNTLYILDSDIFNIILFITIYYSILMLIEIQEKPKINHKTDSLLVQDKPIDSTKDDELGFSIFAERDSTIIKKIVNNEKSVVFGIEGGWGCGKTSYINLIKEDLEKDPAINIIDFNPWMSSNIEMMITDFFSRMAEEVRDIRLTSTFRQYGKLLAKTDGSGFAEGIVDHICPDKDLASMLESINGCIKRLDLRFVIFIDDMDRLDKDEIMAVLKLVRNTASMYQTVFVLAYDIDYLTAQLRSYFGNNNEKIASDYIDKIINVTIKLPQEPKEGYLLLKSWVNNSKFVNEHRERGITDDLPDKIANLIDSPRKAKGIFNSLVLESAYPHFKIVPIIDMIALFYLQNYKKEEYDMLVESFKIHAYNKLDIKIEDLNIEKGNIDVSLDPKTVLQSTGQDILNIFNHRLENNSNNNTKSTSSSLNSKYRCTYLLLNRKSTSIFIKYMEFILRTNPIYYSKNINLFNTYGIDGFDGINTKDLKQSLGILDRLNVIKEKFPKPFFDESLKEIQQTYSGEYNETIFKELLSFRIELFFLSKNESSYFYNFIVTNFLHTQSYTPDSKKHFIEIIHAARNPELIKNNFSSYCSKIDSQTRFELVTYVIFNLKYYKYNNEERFSDHPFTDEELKNESIEHINTAIEFARNNRLSYTTVEKSLNACWIWKNNIRTAIDKDALNKFIEYITDQPNGFICSLFRTTINFAPMGENRPVIIHPYLNQLFGSLKEFNNYLNKVDHKIGVPLIKQIHALAQRYAPQGYNKENITNQTYDNKQFQLEQEDFDKLFYIEDGIIKRRTELPEPQK